MILNLSDVLSEPVSYTHLDVYKRQILHDDLQYVVLGHLSKENNYEELAYETVKLEISIGDNPYKGDDIPMMVAKRDQVSDIITL